jgi:transcriptional regulator with XRE-family HTH domain
MSKVTIEKVKVNPVKFKELRGDMSLAEFSENIGIKPDMLSKIERGERWKTLEKFAEFCVRTNQEPNAFFEIVKKIS